MSGDTGFGGSTGAQSSYVDDFRRVEQDCTPTQFGISRTDAIGRTALPRAGAGHAKDAARELLDTFGALRRALVTKSWLNFAPPKQHEVGRSVGIAISPSTVPSAW